jgi:copper chaperone NosL
MTRGARALTLVAALLLGALYVTPLWRVRLLAPQYPEGIGMLIRLNTVEGMKEHDLRNINSLNHYIGMKAIEPDAIPELKFMPWIVAGLIASGLLVAALGRRRLLVGWTAAFALLSAAGLYDFWRWSYDYGHNLDAEKAIIVVPGMTYQPPLIGTKQLLNFTATSLPDIGGIAAGFAMLAAVAAIVLSYRRGRALGLAGAGILAGCVAATPQIELAHDSCERCHMLITDGRFGAVIVTSTGKTLKFDGVDCLVEHLDANPELKTKSLWVSAADAPGTLVPAEQATYVMDGELRAPMGTLVSFGTRKGAESLRGAGHLMTWTELRAHAARPETALGS